MYSKQILFFLIIMSFLATSSCSSNKIRKLTTVEVAEQLLQDQKNNKNHKIQHPMTIHYTVPEKAIMGKEMDIIIEISSKIALSDITLAFDTSRDLRFKNKWLVFSNDSIVEKITNIEADKLYQHTVTLIPEKHGLIFLDVYALYSEGNEQRVKHRQITFSIGNALKLQKITKN